MKYYKVIVGYELHIQVDGDDAPDFEEGYFTDRCCAAIGLKPWSVTKRRTQVDESTFVEAVDPIYDVVEQDSDGFTIDVVR